MLVFVNKSKSQIWCQATWPSCLSSFYQVLTKALCKCILDTTTIKQLERYYSTVEDALLNAPIVIRLGYLHLVTHGAPECKKTFGSGRYSENMQSSLPSYFPPSPCNASFHSLPISDAQWDEGKETVTKCFWTHKHIIEKFILFMNKWELRNTAVNYTSSIYTADLPNWKTFEIQGGKESYERL